MKTWTVTQRTDGSWAILEDGIAFETGYESAESAAWALHDWLTEIETPHKEEEMPRGYFHTVRVRGIGSFPTDMLRYDGLSPRSQEDSVKIDQTQDGEALGREDFITLTRETSEKGWTPTEGRWRSFLWVVVEHDVEVIR